MEMILNFGLGTILALILVITRLAIFTVTVGICMIIMKYIIRIYEVIFKGDGHNV